LNVVFVYPAIHAAISVPTTQVGGSLVPAHIARYSKAALIVALNATTKDYAHDGMHRVTAATPSIGTTLSQGSVVTLTASAHESKPPYSWLEAGHFQAVKTGGATPCFSCHDEHDCSDCHVAISD
jgi:hypothetical protein